MSRELRSKPRIDYKQLAEFGVMSKEEMLDMASSVEPAKGECTIGATANNMDMGQMAEELAAMANGIQNGQEFEEDMVSDSDAEDAELDNSILEMTKMKEKLHARLRREKKRQKIEHLRRENEALQQELDRLTEASCDHGDTATTNAAPTTTTRVKWLNKAKSSDRAKGHKSRKVKAAGESHAVAAAVPSVSSFKQNCGLLNDADTLLKQLGIAEGDDALESSHSSESSDPEATERVHRTSKYERNKHVRRKSRAPTRKDSDTFKIHHSYPNVSDDQIHYSYPNVFDVKTSHVNPHGPNSILNMHGCQSCAKLRSEGGDMKSGPGKNGEVKADLKWPNEHLGARYNNYGKSDTKFKQLDFRLLVAGEINVIMDESTGEKERLARMQLLSDVVFSSAHYQWSAILRFHAAVLAEIESSRMQWGTRTAG